MGAHVSIFALSEGWPKVELAAGRFGDAAQARAAAEELFPGRVGEDLGASTLDQQLYPRGSFWVATAGSTVLITAARLRYAIHLADEAARGRRDTYVLMHSVSDHLEFSTSDGCDDDSSAREVTLTPDMGVEDADMFAFGPELPFERPFWAGERYAGFEPDDEPEPDELPFFPLQLGEEALRAFFGFTVEGDKQPEDLDPGGVPVYGFRWADGKDDGEPEVVKALTADPGDAPEPNPGPEPSPSMEPGPPPTRSWWRRLLGR